MNIVSIGEALIDFMPTGALAFQGYPGGSPLNVAIAAARLGADVGFLSQLSRDRFGEVLHEHLRANRVDTSLLRFSEAPTTLAFVQERDGEPEFEFLANASADSLFDPQPRPELPPSVDRVMFGSVALLQEPASTAIVETVERFRGGLVLFDPNVRPALIPDRNAYLKNLGRWIATSDVVKVSQQDLAWLGLEADAAAGVWLGGRPRAVVVTQGPDGATAYLRGGEVVRVAGVAVDVVDTVGAGDTFSGALLVGLGRHAHVPEGADDWRSALSLAVKAAAINCQRAGMNPPWSYELDGD